MKSSPWAHSLGVLMNKWLTPKDFNEIIILEVNEIWSQADIESVIEEDVMGSNGVIHEINTVAMPK